MVGTCYHRSDPVRDGNNGITDKLDAECGNDKREDRKQCETALIIALHAFERVDKTITVPASENDDADYRISQKDIISESAIICTADRSLQRIKDADELSAQDIV